MLLSSGTASTVIFGVSRIQISTQRSLIFMRVQVFFIPWSKCRDTGKGKAVPLQDWSGPEGSRKLRLPDFMTTAQDSSMFRLYPQEIHLVLISGRG